MVAGRLALRWFEARLSVATDHKSPPAQPRKETPVGLKTEVTTAPPSIDVDEDLLAYLHELDPTLCEAPCTLSVLMRISAHVQHGTITADQLRRLMEKVPSELRSEAFTALLDVLRSSNPAEAPPLSVRTTFMAAMCSSAARAAVLTSFKLNGSHRK
jgi:hypothetical protein